MQQFNGEGWRLQAESTWIVFSNNMEAVLFFCIIASSGNRYFLSCNPAEQGCFKPQILSVGDWIFFNFVVKDGFVGFPEWRDSEQLIYDRSSSSYKKPSDLAPQSIFIFSHLNFTNYLLWENMWKKNGKRNYRRW